MALTGAICRAEGGTYYRIWLDQMESDFGKMVVGQSVSAGGNGKIEVYFDLRTPDGWLNAITGSEGDVIPLNGHGFYLIKLIHLDSKNDGGVNESGSASHQIALQPMPLGVRPRSYIEIQRDPETKISLANNLPENIKWLSPDIKSELVKTRVDISSTVVCEISQVDFENGLVVLHWSAKDTNNQKSDDSKQKNPEIMRKDIGGDVRGHIGDALKIPGLGSINLSSIVKANGKYWVGFDNKMP